jgi:hypothetical protein
MPKMPPVFPAKRTAPPVTFKSETSLEKAVRMRDEKESTLPEKPLSNKEVMMVLLVSHIEDSFKRLTEHQMATVAGKSLRGERPTKIREMYRLRVEKLCAGMRKLLTKRQLDGRITSFVPGGTGE